LSRGLFGVVLLLSVFVNASAQGELGKRIEAARQGVAAAEQQYGPEHAETGNQLNALVVALYAAGRVAEAVPIAQRALAISEKAEGSDHPFTGIRLN